MDNKRQLMIRLQMELILSGQFPSCISCEHWRTRTVIGDQDLVEIQICTKYNTTPPPEVIATGCEAYVTDVRF